MVIIFFFLFKVAFNKYEERVEFADRFWNCTHISDQVLAYMETDYQTEKQRRERFPQEVVGAVYSKYGRDKLIETRGRKRLLNEVEKVEEHHMKKKYFN